MASQSVPWEFSFCKTPKVLSCRHVLMRQFPLNFWGAGTRCVEPSHALRTALQGLVVSLDLCARPALRVPLPLLSLQPCGRGVTAMVREAEGT